MVFETKNGSRYYVDTQKKIISGDNLYVREGKKYIHATIMIGQKARFYMANGEIFETSAVSRYTS